LKSGGVRIGIRYSAFEILLSIFFLPEFLFLIGPAVVQANGSASSQEVLT